MYSHVNLLGYSFSKMGRLNFCAFSILVAVFIIGVSTAPSHNEASVQYLPFYGGAKGQYLEIKKDNAGSVTSEKIVPEDKISSENIIKNSNENLLSKVLQANLISLRSVSSSLLKLHNVGRRVGYLGNTEKARFKEQLASLEETASNTIKIIDDIGSDIDMLFKNNATQRKYEYEDDYVEDIGVGIDAPTDSDSIVQLQGATIAEAKPVGLAIIGENGLAASRPQATAIASSGVALARPIATAVAGVDPTKLGLHYQVDHTKL
ncbi:hypothetical protein ACJJTC_005475 [Scirpophaga incertulas]